MTDDEVDRSSAVADLRQAFDRYEAALTANDVDTMNELFWSDTRAVRYGLDDLQIGHEAIAEWRRRATPVPTDRRHERVQITTFGDDAGVVHCEFRNGDEDVLGRQTQVWVRVEAVWRIVSAHVSAVAD